MPAAPDPVSLDPIRTMESWCFVVGMLVAAITLAIALGGVFYCRPLWVIEASTRAWLRLAGVRSQFAQLGPHRIHYFVGGRGRPLVLVHGLGAEAESWARLMPALMRRGHRVYAVDLLGFGRSDRPDVDYSIALQAKVLTQFFVSQNLAHADVGGWSMGGWVVLTFALDHPELVRRLFVVDSAGLNFQLPFDPALFQPRTVDQARQLLALLTPQADRIPRFVARDLVREMRPTRWVVQRALTSMTAGGDLLDGKLHAIQPPVLIVWGKQDTLIPLACGEEMHRQMSGSRLVVLDGCGHLAPIECSQRVLPVILHLLAADPPLPASVDELPE